ncbi:MAG: PPOX class F420-dependent oxidoreductase [Candidatus Heimdallarchaeota archaeon]
MVKTQKVPESHLDLFKGKHIAHVATLNPDNSIQISPVWIDYNQDEDYIVFSTSNNRKKSRNLKIGSKLAISLPDMSNPYRYLAIQGEVIELDHNQSKATALIDSLAKRYMDKDKYPLADGEKRITVRIKPNYVHTSG